jgi:hypothetical protein
MEQAFRVVKPYQTPYAEPLTFQADEKLRFERRASEWEGWIWCTAPSGKAAWVPERWGTLEGKFCILQRDYTATELSVVQGELLTAEAFESGWAWARNERGEWGWVPLTHLSPETQAAAPYPLPDAAQVQMLRKLMLYWDGQWFLKTVEAFGLEAAIDLNARVRASFGRIEMRILLKTVGKSQADDLPDALRLLETYASTFMGGGVRADFVMVGKGQAEVIVRRCAAYEGAKQAALPRQDQACVACETLWHAWLETLLPGVQIEVDYPLRLGKGDQVCRFVVEIPAAKDAE